MHGEELCNIINTREFQNLARVLREPKLEEP